jgi:predicted amidophosphoribosyltransferase
MYSLVKIDELLRPNHIYLEEDDECFYLMEYIPVSRLYNAENDLMMNFKKEMDRKGKSEWKYKGIAINKIANIFDKSLPQFTLANIILVPIPPSKVKSDAMYDDRIVQVLKILCDKRNNSDLREIISIKKNMQSSHSGKKYTPEEIYINLHLDKSLCKDKKKNIILVDDVITYGAHFKACQKLLRDEFPNSHIKGLFIGRTNK